MQATHEGLTWCVVTDQPLAVAEALSWAALPSCGAVVTFCGMVRDHSVGREGVTSLTYEAYEEHVVSRMEDVATSARAHWPEVGRVALLHRLGELGLGEVSVVVVVSAPHRAQAFDAARYCIDTLKRTVPIWKRERWEAGEEWADCSSLGSASHGATHASPVTPSPVTPSPVRSSDG